MIAIWIPENSQQPASWLAYGDSSIFVFDSKLKRIEFCSFPNVIQFNDSPYLLNWKENPSPKGFSNGEFLLNEKQIILMASDAMSQYIFIKYLLWEKSASADLQLTKLEASGSSLASQMIRMRALNDQDDFFSDTIPSLIKSLDSNESFRSLTDLLGRKGLLAFDDYTLIAIY